MRITTQVLNTSMRKAGLPVDTMSLLSGINSSSQSNGLLSALSKDGIKTVCCLFWINMVRLLRYRRRIMRN